MPGASDDPGIPQTIKEVDLPGRIRAADGTNLKDASELFGWEPVRISKDATEFDKDERLSRGWIWGRLLRVAEGYEHIARITPSNPSAAGRAAQLRDLAEVVKS